MELSGDDLVLKLIALKRGWATRETWVRAILERREGRTRKPLHQLLGLSQAQAAEVADTMRRKAYLKRMVEEEEHFWTEPPSRIGRYEVEGVCARGGRGVVFRARRENRPYAIKVLAHTHAFDLEEVERFQRQREFGLLLDHPNLIKVHEAGTWEEAVPWIAMEWVEGRPLSEHLSDGPGGPGASLLEDLVDWFVQAAKGLAHAHAHSVLHKDLKPDNILVDRVGHVIVTDFGVAQKVGEAYDEGLIVGTPAYMSPEQAAGEVRGLDPRADVFSLGASLYECLTRRQPYQGDDRHEILKAAGRGRFLTPRKLNPDIPPALEAVVLKAMERKAVSRTPSMTVFASELEQWRGRGGGSGPESSPSWLKRALGG